ncbi:MAG: agmatine deiminase family protein [Spirochaetes bacterium]|nr:agmatine deiminase family protein [Spirochaetota bacterium]
MFIAMIHLNFYKKVLIVFLFCLSILNIAIAQVSNPRIPAEWEEQQAVVMEVEMKSMSAVVPWEVAIDPYIKTAQACIDEGIDLYLIQRESHFYHYYDDSVIGDFDTIFTNRGIDTSLIHFIEYPDSIKDNYIDFWARDNGMFCVYENGVGSMSMYHFENDYLSEIVDSCFFLTSTLLEKQNLDLGYKIYDGGNFLTDGHGTFNIMCGGTNEIINDYLHFKKYFGIDKSLNMYIQASAHIDVSVKMLNEETIIVSMVGFANTIKNSGLLSAFGRKFNIVTLEDAPDYDQGDFTIKSASYTNSLILNNTVLVPQYSCDEFDYHPQTDSLAIEAYKKGNYSGHCMTNHLK